jgi:hypothetical protein
MDRRTGFAAAGAVTLVLIAGAFAAGANLGIVHARRGAERAGVVRQSTTEQPQVVTVEVRETTDPAPASADVPVSSGKRPVRVVDVPISSTGTTASHETESRDDSGESSGEAEGDD